MGSISNFNCLNIFGAMHRIFHPVSSFESDLALWVETEPSSNRKTAADRIKHAFENKETELNLFNLGLSDIPSCIGQLSQLTVLNLWNNNLESLPSEIGQLSQLTKLFLQNNNLTSLPPEIGQLSLLEELHLVGNFLESLPSEIGQLSQLIAINLWDNKLESIPSEIGQLSLLIALNLRGNNLTSLPSEIGRLYRLRNLHLIDNPELADLPFSLGQALSLIEISIRGTQIGEDERDTTLNQCKALREERASKIFPSRLKRWEQEGQITPSSLQAVLEFEEQKIKSLNEWLVRLENTKDFNSKFQKTLAEAVCEMLVHVAKDEDFQDSFFFQIEANLACCQDRAAMALNEIYTSYKISASENSDSPEERFQTMVKGAKTIALRTAIAERIDAYQKENNVIESEAVEIYLYYETALRDKLNLLSIIKSMAYSEIGKRDWISKGKLMKEVKTSYLDKLIELPSFEKIIKDDKEYREAYEKKMEGFQKELEKLESSKLSQESLEWKIRALGERQKLTIKELKKEWAEKRL